MPTRFAEELRLAVDSITHRACACVRVEGNRAQEAAFLDALGCARVSIGSNWQYEGQLFVTVSCDNADVIKEEAEHLGLGVRVLGGSFEITIQGERLPQTPGILAKAYHALDVFNGVPILIGSPTTITVIVPEEEGKTALPLLLAAFGFEASSA